MKIIENHFLSLHWTLGISHQPWLATLNGKIQGKWKVPGCCNETIPTRHQIWKVSEVTWDTFYAVPIFCAHFLHNKQVVEWQAGQKISSAENGGFVSNTSKGGTGSNDRHASKHQTSRNQQLYQCSNKQDPRTHTHTTKQAWKFVSGLNESAKNRGSYGSYGYR